MRILAKILLIVVGSLGGIYAIAAVVQFVNVLFAVDADNPYRTATIAASVAPICFGLMVCIACFSAAFKKPKE